MGENYKAVNLTNYPG